MEPSEGLWEGAENLRKVSALLGLSAWLGRYFFAWYEPGNYHPSEEESGDRILVREAQERVVRKIVTQLESVEASVTFSSKSSAL